MTALWIIGGIVVFFVLLFQVSITLYVHLTDQLFLRVGALGLKFWIVNPNQDKKPRKKSEKKQTKKVKAEKKPKKKKKSKIKEELGDTKEKRSFEETVRLVLSFVSSTLKPLGLSLKKVRITCLDLRMAVGAEDAYKTATNYALICSGIYTAIAALKANIKVQIRHMEINANFISEEVEQDISFKVKIRIGTVVLAAVRIIKNYLHKLIKKQTSPSVGTTHKTEGA